MNAFRWPFLFALLVAVAAAAGSSSAPRLSADDALARLVAGNLRSWSDAAKHPNQDGDRRMGTATNGQHPFAIVLACADSRVAPEQVFDQGIGDLFVIRVAGNVAGVDETASIEYAAGLLQAPLCVVIGHANCGAVKAALDGGALPGRLPELISQIAPAAERARTQNPQLTGSPLLAAAVECNVWLSIEDLFQRSAVVRGLVTAGKLRVVGAVYDLGSGKVRWLGPHPEQARLLKQ